MRNLILALFILICSCSGCYLKRFPLNYTVVDSATYKLHVMYTDDQGDMMSGQGTAWAVNSHDLITAGHMCDGKLEDMALESPTGKMIRAKSKAWEHTVDYNINGDADLCLIHTDIELNNWLIISNHMPKFHEDIWFVGYSDGKHSFSAGRYLGDMDGATNHANDHAFTAPCDHGASGSPVFLHSGVWGVLVRLRTDMPWDQDGSDGCVAVPLKELTNFLKEMNVDYMTTPDPLPPGCSGNEMLDFRTNTCVQPLG